jgi:hypothetical protein
MFPPDSGVAPLSGPPILPDFARIFPGWRAGCLHRPEIKLSGRSDIKDVIGGAEDAPPFFLETLANCL